MNLGLEIQKTTVGIRIIILQILCQFSGKNKQLWRFFYNIASSQNINTVGPKKSATKWFDCNFVMVNQNSVFLSGIINICMKISSDVVWGWSNEDAAYSWAKRKAGGNLLRGQINCSNPTLASKTFCSYKSSRQKDNIENCKEAWNWKNCSLCQ